MAKKTTQAELIEALREDFPDLEDGLFSNKETGRVLGFVASDVFQDEEHEERQDRLWAAIDRHFSQEEQRNLGPIVTMTHAEAETHAVESD